MKSGLVLVLLISVSLGVQAQSPTRKETVTNQTIIDMVAAKLPADLIITKIQTSPTVFDLSIEGLIALNRAGVPSEVIKAMMQKRPEVAPAPIVATNIDKPATPLRDPEISALQDPNQLVAKRVVAQRMPLCEPGTFTPVLTYA